MSKQLRARLARIEHDRQDAPGRSLVRDIRVNSPSGRGVEIYTVPPFKTQPRFLVDGCEASEGEHHAVLDQELAASRAQDNEEEDV